jgi:hypothetical protein
VDVRENLPAVPDDASVPGCWCCAAYDIYRPAFRDGRCVLCAVLPGLCEPGHRMLTDHPEWSAIERERIERMQNGGEQDA